VQEFVLIFLANAACILVLIAVHETGHFLAGWAGGIPVGEMRIRLLTFPQHVALRDGEEWVSPVRDLERYVAIMQRHLGSGARLFLYTAGGMLLGTVFAVAASVLAKEAGFSGMAIMIAAQSLGMGWMLSNAAWPRPWHKRPPLKAPAPTRRPRLGPKGRKNLPGGRRERSRTLLADAGGAGRAV
jgi:hypothetical protein